MYYTMIEHKLPGYCTIQSESFGPYELSSCSNLFISMDDGYDDAAHELLGYLSNAQMK